MVVTCHLAGVILSGAKIAPMVTSMVLSIILLVVRIALLVMIRIEEFFTDNEEYSYIFRNGNWFAYDMHQFEDTVAPEPVEIPLEHLQYETRRYRTE